MTDVAALESLPGRQGGAKALLITVLGEFVLPAGGSVWTATLVDTCALLGVSEKNARQAIARVGDQGIIESQRHGRRVSWHLTEAGRGLLEAGAERIYSFGTDTVEWNGEWLVAHCPVPEIHRALRHQLRTELSFHGCGELAASLAVSPHVAREPTVRRILERLGLVADSLVFRSRTGSSDEDADLVARAWDLEALGSAYTAFGEAHGSTRPADADDQVRAVIELVHDWRRFPFTDPELPTSLLPIGWAGTSASAVFHDRRNAWAPGAAAWFADRDRTNAARGDRQR